MNKLRMTINKDSLFVILLSSALLLNSPMVFGDQQAESSSKNEKSPIESTLKKTVNFLIWPLRKTLEFKDKVLGKDKEKQILKNQIESKKTMLKELKSQLGSYVPGGNVERCAKLLLKKEVLDKREDILKKILTRKKNRLTAVQNALALLQGTPASTLKTTLAHGGGIIGGALIGYTTVQFVSDRLFESGHTQLASLLKEQQIVVQKMQELKAVLKHSAEQEELKKNALQALDAPAPEQSAVQIATQKTSLEQELAKIKDSIAHGTTEWNALKHAYDILNEKIITPQNSSTLVSIIRTCAPWVGAAIGALIGYKIADKLFVPVARTLSENEQVEVLKLQRALQEAQKAFDIITGKYNNIADQVQALDNLPNNIRTALSDYLTLKEQIKETEEYLTKRDIFEILGL